MKPTHRYTITAFHPNAVDGKPLVCITYDEKTLAETRADLAAKGFTKVEVKTEVI